jgi:hypothetical protein
MSAMTTLSPVGGRLEAEPPRPVTNPGDRWRLVVLLVLAAAVHALIFARTVMTARDGVGFARTAVQLAHPSSLRPDATVFDVLRQPGHPPGYPTAVLAAATASDAVSPGQAPQERLLGAAQLVSAVAGTLLVFPLYWLGRTLFGQTEGFAGAALFQCLPVAARYTTDAVTEGLYLLLLAMALLLGTRAVRKPTIGGYLACGLTVGLAYLVRPEGALAAAAVGLVALPVRSGGWGPTFGRLAALTVGFVLVTSPYMALIGGWTNKPNPGGLLTFQARPGVSARPVGGPAVFASWAAGDHRLGGAVREVGKEFGKSFHYLPPAFALVGLVVAARRLRTEPHALVPVAFAGLMLPVLLALAYKESYVSERHTLSAVMVGCPFAAAGFAAVGRRLGHVGYGWALLAAVLASCLPGLAKPLHEHRLGHRLIGEYLAAHADPGDVILDPYDWAGFYSGRTLASIPPDPPAVPGRVRWAVVEPTEKNRSKLPRLEAAWNVVNDGANPAELVPVPGVDPARVALYRQVIR